MGLEKVKRNERLEGVFNRAAVQYETIGPNYFSYYGKMLVEYAKVKERATVLDVAFGKGASLFPAANKVTKNGQVIGIDFSQEMVTETKALIHDKGLRNVKVLQMDAENLEFSDNNFDCVLCGLSTAFFSDSLTAIKEMHRVLKADGTLGLSTWKRREKEGVLDRAYKTLFPQNQHRNLSTIKGRPDFGSYDGVDKILKDVGLKSIEIFIEKKTFYYKDEEEWWQEQWTNATRGLFEHIETIGSDALNQFKEQAFIEIMKYKDDHGIRFDTEVIFSFGHK